MGVIPASGNQRSITKIQVLGNDKIESSAILGQITVQVGDLLSVPSLRSDMRRIYEMGYFTDVQVDVKETEAGALVTFVVIEKPSIGRILVLGNEKIETSKIREKVDIPIHSIIDIETKKLL